MCLQKNDDYESLLKLINKVKPDIILAMETNKRWEKELEKIEGDYPQFYKVPLENRYGMHFYTHLKMDQVKEHYFISDERASS